jgi:hypothetical protein
MMGTAGMHGSQVTPGDPGTRVPQAYPGPGYTRVPGIPGSRGYPRASGYTPGYPRARVYLIPEYNPSQQPEVLSRSQAQFYVGSLAIVLEDYSSSG